MSRSSVDERAAAPLEASRKGAHRARARAFPSAVPVVAGVAVIFLVVGGVYAVLTGGSNPTQSIAGAEDDASASASASSTPKATQSATTRATQSATTNTQAATVDKSVDVVVLNSVSVQGLALRVKNSLEADGWHVVKTGNAQERGLATTKVYYPSAALKPTARQIVRDLGFGTIIQNASVSGSGTIKMALGNDAT